MAADGVCELDTFDTLKTRLDEIVSEVSSEDISLDEALRLYDEAVNIGLAACDASEDGLDSVSGVSDEEGNPVSSDIVQSEEELSEGAISSELRAEGSE